MSAAHVHSFLPHVLFLALKAFFISDIISLACQAMNKPIWEFTPMNVTLASCLTHEHDLSLRLVPAAYSALVHVIIAKTLENRQVGAFLWLAKVNPWTQMRIASWKGLLITRTYTAMANSRSEVTELLAQGSATECTWNLPNNSTSSLGFLPLLFTTSRKVLVFKGLFPYFFFFFAYFSTSSWGWAFLDSPEFCPTLLLLCLSCHLFFLAPLETWSSYLFWKWKIPCAISWKSSTALHWYPNTWKTVMLLVDWANGSGTNDQVTNPSCYSLVQQKCKCSHL